MSLPVHNAAVRGWNDLLAARSALASLQSQRANTRQYIPPVGPNPTYTELEKKIAQQSKLVGQIESHMDSTSERYWLWIELPTRERCKNGEPTCLDNVYLGKIWESMLNAPIS
jgi:hypothetical protein